MTATSDTVDRRVVVAMSGGVDSSVSALLLHKAGYQVVGVSMQVWDYRRNGGCSSKATCCSPDDFTDARMVAARVGVPYYVFDFEDTFQTEVIDKFVATYKSGQTPNPCVDCNNRVKFRELRERASSLGIPRVATGHFARIRQSEDGYHLLRGSDPDKDQSYFLYGLKQQELGSTLFPVGEMTKADVREVARGFGLSTAEKPESQDICFVSGELKDFLIQIGVPSRRGNIVNSSGEVLTQHEGIQQFTVGQRKGLGLGGSVEPLYVTRITPETNTVEVGPKAELERSQFKINRLNWIAPGFDERLKGGASQRVIAQLRYRHSGVSVDLSCEGEDTVRADFVDDWSTVSPGQAAVFYDEHNEEVIGGGTIMAE